MSSEFVSRRTVMAAAGAAALAPLATAQARVLPAVAVLGDSITSGYGLPAREALPAKLQAALAKMGEPVRIIAAGISGDTTAGGAARVDRAVPASARVCVVALGGNDLLNGQDPAALRANLQRIVTRLQARGVKVVLAGLKVPPLLQGDYARAFDDAFASVGRTPGVLFLPDMLGPVVLNPALNQRDGIHPNAAGAEVIARRLAPLVAQALRQG